MSGKTSRRRFIAGATCPNCGEEDKVFTQIRQLDAMENNESEQLERGCVACEFLEAISDIDTPMSQAEETPVNVTGAWSPVKLPD